jgi:uncharacterized iron-regulated protein
MGQFINRRKLQKLVYLLFCVFSIFVICDRFVNAQFVNDQKVVDVCRPQFVVELGAETKPISEADPCQEKRFVTPDLLVRKLAQANAIYLGESHDRSQDRKIQLAIIQELHEKNSQIAIAMEMFQIPYQAAIDRYLAGKLSEEDLIEQTEYNQRWGYDWESYAPILRFAKEQQLPVLALNTPSEITRQVAKAGLDSLTPQQRKIIPPVSEIRTDNAAYRQMLAKVFQQHQHSSHGHSSGFDRFFLAQVLWDETMAAEIANFVKANPKYQVVAIAGQGHIIYGYGIPSRVARRMHRQFLQLSVLLSPPQEVNNSQQPIADYIWQ